MNNSIRLTVITLLLAVSNLSAATLTVGGGGTYGTIQQAVDAAATGDIILVSDGVYAGGVTVNKPLLRLQSVNGPQFTVIDAGSAGRCVTVTNADGASLFGFTLTNGACYANGAGVWCTASNVCLTNCTLAGNSTVYGDGGGAYGCTLYNCTLTRNSSAVDYVDFGHGGGAHSCTLYNCTLTDNRAGGVRGATSVPGSRGGGACNCTLYNCTLAGNTALDGNGGGAYGCTLYNCTLTYNAANRYFKVTYGGGACSCTLYNCTLKANSAEQGLGAYGCGLNNCIVDDYWLECVLSFCCARQLPWPNIGNITNAPMFVSGTLRLQSNSPCINAGNNTYVTTSTDLDGNPRIVGGTVDMGAYECQSPALLDYFAWAQGYGLTTDSSAVYADSDSDGLNNWQEWVCVTCPTNPLSVLRLFSAVPASTNVTVRWQSVSGVNYFLERSTDLASPFKFVATNILGQAGTTSYADTNATGAGRFFYRVGVNCP